MILQHDASEQGLVLLENKGSVLPLDKSKRTAAIGPLASARGTLIGNYMGQICPDNGDGKETYACVQTLAEALGNASSAAVTTASGVPSVLSNSTAGFADALAAATAADQVVLFLGIDGTVEGEGKDRHAIGLPAGQIHEILTALQTNGMDPLTYIDYLAYIPMFIDVHKDIVEHPFDTTSHVASKIGHSFECM